MWKIAVKTMKKCGLIYTLAVLGLALVSVPSLVHANPTLPGDGGILRHWNPALINQAIQHARVLLTSEGFVMDAMRAQIGRLGVSGYTQLRYAITDNALSYAAMRIAHDEASAQQALGLFEELESQVSMSGGAPQALPNMATTVGWAYYRTMLPGLTSRAQAMNLWRPVTDLFLARHLLFSNVQRALFVNGRVLPASYYWTLARRIRTDLIRDLYFRGLELAAGRREIGLRVSAGFARRVTRWWVQAVSGQNSALSLLRAPSGSSLKGIGFSLGLAVAGVVCHDAGSSTKFFDCLFDTSMGISKAGAEPRYKNGHRCEGAACD